MCIFATRCSIKKDILSCKLTPPNFLFKSEACMYIIEMGAYFPSPWFVLTQTSPQRLSLSKKCEWIDLILVSWSKVKVIADLFEKALSVLYFSLLCPVCL